ncbi:hypothetical protein NL50_04635 [Clostridium acetobutylicum]|nr:hypothetical protein NL50_04635 [Clostridium acetobutylicum]
MNSSTENITLKLKSEQLDIAKQWIQTEDVKAYKETSSIQKTFTIPVEREELVIEKIPTASHDKKEVIRIPLSEEEVNFSKHRIILEDVSIYKNQIEDVRHIEETLKKENPKIETFGNAKVIKK